MQTKEYLEQLLLKYIRGTISESERSELFVSLDSNEQSGDWKQVILKMSLQAEENSVYNDQEWEPVIQEILRKQPEFIQPGRDGPSIRRTIFVARWWAAAAIFVLIGTGTWFLFFRKPVKDLVQTASSQPQDVKPPQTTRAMISLANGQRIFLDSAGSGLLATQGNVKVLKTANGQIVYNRSGENDMAVTYNTLFNPRGSKVVSLTLSDGTTVWLNSESSLTYPAAFVGKERKVSITGEAYFEVAHNRASPFIVSKGDDEIRVLGTHFNVNAYEDAVKVTLLLGSVKVSRSGESKLMTPGEQAVISNQINIKADIDLDKVIAWKNGIFNFSSEDITGIMQELGRWYDADIVYEGDKPTDLFSAIVNRDNNISQVLKLFEQTRRIHFKIEGRKVIVMK